MPTYAEKLEAVLENTLLSDWKTLVSDYFETETVNRESVLNVLYNDLERIRCVQGRPRLPSIIQNLSYLGWDKDMEPTPPFTDPNSEWTNEEIIKYAWLKGDQTDFWKDKKVCDIGCGSGTSTIITHLLGSVNCVYEPMEESAMIAACNFILFDYDVLFYQDMATEESIDMSYDTYIMSRVFYDDFAEGNVNLGKFLKASGKEVIIASKTLVEETNSFATLPSSDYEMILDIPILSDPPDYGNRYVVKLI